MDEVLKKKILEAVRITGKIGLDALQWMEEDLTQEEYQWIDKFFKYLNKNNLSIGHGNIDNVWEKWHEFEHYSSGESYRIYNYIVTLQHDHGKVKISTTSTSILSVVKMIMASEHCPESAIVNIKIKEMK